MAAPRKSAGERFIERFSTSRGPGWTQAQRNLERDDFHPSWSPSGKLRESDLRAIYGSHQRTRLSSQERAQRRAEVDRFVRGHRLNARRAERLSEEQISRNRKAPAIPHYSKEEPLGPKAPGVPRDARYVERESVWIGNFDTTLRTRPLAQTDIINVITDAYRRFPGQAANNLAHWYFVRAHLEVDYDQIPKGSTWYKYVEQAKKETTRVRETKDGKAYVRIIIGLPVTRGEIEAAAHLATADKALGGTWATRFAEGLFGIRGVSRIIGWSMGPLYGTRSDIR